jgi:hypothetical protein
MSKNCHSLNKLLFFSTWGVEENKKKTKENIQQMDQSCTAE